MVDEVFGWAPRANEPQGSVAHATLEARFGDGYAQVAADGLNNARQSWPLTFVGREAYVAAIRDFFDRHKGARSFLWTPPLGVQGRYLARGGYQLTPKGKGLYSITATFEQVFHP